MSQIIRLHNTDIADGKKAMATSVGDELNQLVSAHNDNDTRLSSLETKTIDDTQVGSTNTSTLGALLNWIANAIKRVTGLPNWYSSPTRTLEAVNADLVRHESSTDHDNRYYTETEIDGKINTLNTADSTNATNLTAHKTSTDHDGRYYTETEIDGKISTINTEIARHESSTDHDNRYYTETEIDGKINTLNTADSTNATNLTAHKTSTDHDDIYINKSNTTLFTPSADYHPATKKYVDDSVVAAGGYNDEKAQDAVGNMLTDTSTIDFTYNDATNTITADIKASSLSDAQLAVGSKVSTIYTTTNSGNAYSITAGISAYADGQTFKIKVNVNSTGNTSLNVNGKGAVSILKANGTNVTNLKLNGVYTVVYSSGNFILQGEGASGNATASDLLSGKTATTDAGEITGTLACTGDAIASNVLSGKKFYKDDPKVQLTGTMPDYTGNYDIPESVGDRWTDGVGNLYVHPSVAGYISGANCSIKMNDSDFVASNIKSGVNIFNVTGTFGTIKSKQTIVNAIWNGDTINTTKNITIPTPVSDITKCVVTIQYPNDGFSVVNAATYVELINTTTIRCTRNSSGSAVSSNYIITVIEFDNVKSKQTGISAGNTASITVSSVNQNKCLLFLSIKASYAGSNIVQFNSLYIDSATAITNILSNSNVTISWQLIEFN